MTIPSTIRDQIEWRIAKTTYVVLVKEKDGTLNLIVDPGLGKPWSTKLKKMADQVATECDGMACTFEEAVKLLIKFNFGGEDKLEKFLVDRIEKLAKIPKQKFFKSNSNEIVDQHGKPIAKPN